MEFKRAVKIKKRICEQYRFCCECPLHDSIHGGTCSLFMQDHVEETEKILEEWEKEHPIKTNRDKFIDIFGRVISQSHDHPGYFIINSICNEEEADKWLNAEAKKK